MTLQPGEAAYLREQFEELAVKWIGFHKPLHGFYPARHTRPLLRSLAKWSDQVVRAFSIECFPSYIHKPPISNIRARSVATRLTGSRDKQQAGLRIIFWAALFESAHWAGVRLKHEQNPFQYDIAEWFDTLFDVSEDRVTAIDGPVQWVRETLDALIAKHAGPAVQFDRQTNCIQIDNSKTTLSASQFNVLQTLFEYGKTGLTGDELSRLSGHTDARKILTRAIARRPTLQNHVILPQSSGGGGYRWI